jgi:ubiquinone/menaquinone biosynthesis C-methylase UbiE
MSKDLIIFISLICCVAFILIIIKRKKPFPCPFYLTFLLENPYMKSVSGSDLLIKRINLQPGMRVLDVGCGPGRLTIPLAKHVGKNGEVVSLDIQENMLKKLKKRIQSNHLNNIKTILSEIGRGHLRKRDYFDRVILVTVLGEIPDKKQALKEIFVTLKPGGILSITEVLPDPDYQSKRIVIHLAKSVGFDFDQKYSRFLSYTLNFLKPK